MAETSRIEWTDATVNFWWGCTKVGPGCDHCYAETWDARTGGAHWGTGTPRRKIASAAGTLARLNHQPGKRVFIQSMSDLFDNEVPQEWFDEAWWHILANSLCRIQIVTKRISMVEKRLAAGGWTFWPRHAGLMITVCNQAEADRDVPRLLDLKAKLDIPWVGLSMEPLLGPVDLTAIQHPRYSEVCALSGYLGTGMYGGYGPKLDWVITGGESGPGARPMHPEWAHSLRDQCVAARVAFFFKQWGEWAWASDDKAFDEAQHHARLIYGTKTHLEHHSDGRTAARVGKARSGRLLDGTEWSQMPGVFHC